MDVNLEFSNITTGVSVRYNSFMKNMDYIFGSPEFNGNANGLFALDVGVLDSQERMKKGDLIIDYRIGYHINKHVSISFIIDNILNREYQTRPADLGPPRAYTLKLSAKI
jgi:iron complex outermembrane receptor protein